MSELSMNHGISHFALGVFSRRTAHRVTPPRAPKIVLLHNPTALKAIANPIKVELNTEAGIHQAMPEIHRLIANHSATPTQSPITGPAINAAMSCKLSLYLENTKPESKYLSARKK